MYKKLYDHNFILGGVILTEYAKRASNTNSAFPSPMMKVDIIVSVSWCVVIKNR